MDNIVKFKRSSVTGKLPLPSQLAYGELAVNFSANNPFLSIKNNQDQIEKFLSEKGLMSLLTESYYDKQTINQMFEAFDPSGEIDFDNYYEKAEADAKFQTISGMSSYLTIAQAEQDYQPKGNYLTEHQSLENYYTKSEADGKFLISHQDLSDYAQKSDLDDYLTIASASTTYATKSEIPDISDLATKSEIPDTSGFATKQELEDYQMKSGMTSYLTIAQAEQDLQPKGDYALASQIPDTSNFITSGYTENHYQPKGTYVIPSDLNDYALKSEIPSIEGLATEAELANYQPQSAMTGYSTTAHTHDYSEIQNTPDLSGFASLSDIPDTSNFITSAFTEEHYMKIGSTPTDVYTKSESDSKFQPQSGMTDYALKSELPSTTGLASETWVSNNFSTTAHTHSEYAEKTDLANYMPNSGMTDYALKSEIPNSYTKTEADNLLAGKANSAHTHTVSDITDLNIPSVEGLASEAWVSQNYQPQSGMSAYSTTAHTHSDLATKAELDDYLTIASASTIYATKEELEEFTPSDNYAGTVWTGTLSEYNNLSVIDTDTLYVITDANQQYVTSGDVESMTSGYTNLTEVQTLLEGYSTTAHTHSYNDLTDKPTIPSTTGLASEEWVTNNFAGTGHTHSQYAEKTDLANYQPQSGMTDYLTVASASTIYATKQELAEFTPSAGYVQNIWVGSLSDYENLTIVDRNTLYCITDEQEQLVTRSYAMNTFATKAMMSDYLTVSAASEMFVEKEAEPLPAYQFVDYIDVSGNTPGIITDYYLTANSVIEFDSEPALANYGMTLYGVTDADWGGMTEGVYAKYGSNLYTYHGYMAESAVQDVPSGRHTFKAGYNYGGEAMAGCQVDDGEIQTCSENYQSWGGQNNLPLGLFGVWSIDYDWNTSQVTGSTWNDNLGMKFNGKFYGCKVYEGNTLMRDYVPCVETSTGKVGIFDTLNDSFYETTASASTTVTGSSSAVTATTEETTSGETSGETSGSTSGSTSGETSGETTGQTAYTIDTSVYEVGDYIDLNRDTYDLNYLITRDSKFVLDIYLQAGQNYEEMFGIEGGGCFKIGTGESEGSVGLIFGDYQTRNTQYYIENDGRYVFEMSSGGTVVNGSIVDDWSQAGTVYGMTNSHCHLGGLWQVMVEDWGDGPMDMSSLRGEPYYRMYNFKVYEGNTLLRDYRPVKRLSDDAIGWFDVVNQTFMGRDENNSSGEGASLGYNE